VSRNSTRFIPRRAFIEKAALEYPLGQSVQQKLHEAGVPIMILRERQRLSIPGNTASSRYSEAKKTLVVRVRKSKEFETCKPSAHYQLPLISSCPGLCEYCYLQTRLGPKPYVRVYVNLKEILEEAQRLVGMREPELTIFEGAATSDPLPIEWLTGSLKDTIEFFGRLERGRFRFVTKFSDVEPILEAQHQRRTTVRFSVNAEYIVKNFEHSTSSVDERISALKRVSDAGFKVGVMVGPIIIFEGWKEQYESLLQKLGEALDGHSNDDGIPFELISHRFTKRAKSNISMVFPNTRLPLDESKRRLKYGQFGYTKYVYPKDTMQEIEDFFSINIPKLVNGGYVQYLV
jgi:spore photoproduct lyase